MYMAAVIISIIRPNLNSLVEFAGSVVPYKLKLEFILFDYFIQDMAKWTSAFL